MSRGVRRALTATAAALLAGCAAITGLGDYAIVDDAGTVDAGAIPDAAVAPAETSSIDAPAPREDATVDAALDAPVEAAPDANPCNLCPPSLARVVCAAGACVPARRVFVSSSAFSSNLGGSNAGDARCADIAKAAGYGGNWKMWLSDGDHDNVMKRFDHPNVAYRLVDGTLVASSWPDLTDGTLTHSIDVDEKGAKVTSTEVWTGTKSSGDGADNKCNGFGPSPQTYVGRVGVTDKVDEGWTSVYDQLCNRTNVHVYCFEQ